MSNQPTDHVRRERLAKLEALGREQDHKAAMNESAVELAKRVIRWWNVDLTKLETKWFEMDDDRLVASVNGVVFELVGDDLHVVGPLGETGKVGCYVIEPNGHYYLAASADDPFSAQQARLN